MGLRVATNMAAITAQNNLAGSYRAINKSYMRLSTGDQITQASDNAAGLSISENFKIKMSGQKQAQKNAMDGISLLQVAEGGLSEFSSIMTRLRELSVQAASDSISKQDRKYLDNEARELKKEAQRIIATTEWGGQKLLDRKGQNYDFHVSASGGRDVKEYARISFDAKKVRCE